MTAVDVNMYSVCQVFYRFDLSALSTTHGDTTFSLWFFILCIRTKTTLCTVHLIHTVCNTHTLLFAHRCEITFMTYWTSYMFGLWNKAFCWQSNAMQKNFSFRVKGPQTSLCHTHIFCATKLKCQFSFIFRLSELHKRFCSNWIHMLHMHSVDCDKNLGHFIKISK